VSEIIAEYKFITVKVLMEKPKTKVYGVFNKRADAVIGVVKWYPHWRQYCFFPEPDTVFSVGCMNDINDFIKGNRQ
jgi:hypothetical protein